MKHKAMTIKKLRGLVDKCLNEGLHLAFFDPEDEAREAIPEEIREAVRFLSAELPKVAMESDDEMEA